MGRGRGLPCSGRARILGSNAVGNLSPWPLGLRAAYSLLGSWRHGRPRAFQARLSPRTRPRPRLPLQLQRRPAQGRQFFSEAKAFRETPAWKKLEQVVSVAVGLGNQAAAKAGEAQHQRIIDARLETPAETARYLADLAFNQTKGTEGPTGIVVEYTTHPGAVAAAQQLMPPAAKVQVGAMFEGNPQLRRLSKDLDSTYVPSPGETVRPAQAAAPAPAAAGAPPSPGSAAGAPGAAAAPPAAAPAGGAAPAAGAAGPQGDAADASPPASPTDAQADAGADAQRPAVPPGYEPGAGASLGCPVRN